MTFYQTIIFSLMLLLSGCGSNSNSHETNTTVILNDQPSSTEEINVTKAKEMIRAQVDDVVEIYDAKDKKNLFVYRESIYNYTTYWLQDYDITGEIPKFRNEILSGTEFYNEVSYVIPLKNGKLLYQAGVFSTRVVVYDYIMQKIVRAYHFLRLFDKVEVSLDENFLIVGEQDDPAAPKKQKFDISDIYQETLPEYTAKYDYENKVYIDEIHKLIWQADVTDETYTFDEAIAICASKPKYNWRLPTMQDIINKGSVSTAGKRYWLQPDLETNDKIYAYTFSNNGYYDIYNDYRDGYNRFTYEYRSLKYYVQCIADKPSDIE